MRRFGGEVFSVSAQSLTSRDLPAILLLSDSEPHPVSSFQGGTLGFWAPRA